MELSKILDNAIEDFHHLVYHDCNEYIEKYEGFLVTFGLFPRGLRAQEDSDEVHWKISKELKSDIMSFVGNIRVRFPPEPSGYFHCGHAKALLLNHYISTIKPGGELVIRFDDTNPSNEEVHFEEEMIKDMASLVVIKNPITYTSDYFDLLLECAGYLVATGNAYVDFTPDADLKKERLLKVCNKYRNQSIEDNRKFWNEMISGTIVSAVLRLKLDMQSKNGCMRDPILYRSNNIPHAKTGSKFKVYPTYDFACPVVDVMQNITHVFRSTEFTDRDARYRAILDMLGWQTPKLYGYGKLVFKDVVLSKRKIKKLIEDGKIAS